MSKLRSLAGYGLVTLAGILQAVAYILICLPAFGMTGSVLRPLAIAFLGGIAATSGVFIKKLRALFVSSAGLAQLLTVLFFVVFAVAKELQINADAGWVPYWIEFFYFDKLLILGTVWLSGAIVVALSRLFVKDGVEEYRLFFKLSSFAFVCFYGALLIYSFILLRLQRGEYPISLTPFSTVRDYMADWASIPYEVFMMFFGNLLYFTPLGYIFHSFLCRKSKAKRLAVIVLFPLVAFSLLELSQYFFQNGYCEIDDMLMNSIGFWFGAVLCIFADKLAGKLTSGRLKAFWGY